MDAASVRIRPATLDDAERLALVGQATFLETFAGVLAGDDIVAHCAREHSAARYRAWLGDGGFSIWLAETEPGQAPIGYLVVAGCTLPVADLGASDLEIKRIYLLSRFHGRGVGAALMQTAIDAAQERGARRLLLGVHVHNRRAVAFYGKHGFRQIGERSFQVGANRYEDVVLARAL